VSGLSFPETTRASRPRSWRERRVEADADDRLRQLPRVFGFILVAWLSFGLLDLYIFFVLARDSSLAWIFLWRGVGALPPLVGWVRTRKGAIGRLEMELEVATFLVMALCIGMQALRWGGLDSHLLHGIPLLLFVQTMALPSPWRRMAPPVAGTFLVYPVVMAVAALGDETIAAQWGSSDVFYFLQDYISVAGCAIGGIVGGHILWSVRRELHRARRLARYRLKARIGHGGTSEVWLAWDDALKRDVAVKILDRTVSADAQAIARFEREAMAASGLVGPHSVRVYDFGASDDGVWFIAMEHLEGIDLATLVEESGPVAPKRAVRLVRQACTALGEAHDAGIVHRDVKPENLFVCRVGNDPDFVKVLDFGIAKIEGADEGVPTRAGRVHGTPAFMSPEVCSGERADARSDVYALGAVLYYLLTGTPPFGDGASAEVMLAHIRSAPMPPSQITAVPSEVETIVMRCLAKDPAERFATAGELEAALAQFARSSLAPPPGAEGQRAPS
jgi:serine/threonine-protein kinase